MSELVRDAAFFFMAVPLRAGGGSKGPAIKKNIFFYFKKISRAKKLEGVGLARTLNKIQFFKSSLREATKKKVLFFSGHVH